MSYLLQEPDPAWASELQPALTNDAELVVDGLHAYLRTPRSLAEPFLTGPAARRFATAGTSRNWRTTAALADLGDQVAAAVTSTA